MFLARGGGGGGLEPTAEKAVRKGRNWGRLGTRDDPREKPRRTLFSSREETSAPCEFLLQVDASFRFPWKSVQTSEFMPLVYEANPWNRSSFPRREEQPETLGVAVNATDSNRIFRIGRMGGAVRIYFDHVSLPTDSEDAVYVLDHR